MDQDWDKDGEEAAGEPATGEPAIDGVVKGLGDDEAEGFVDEDDDTEDVGPKLGGEGDGEDEFEAEEDEDEL